MSIRLLLNDIYQSLRCTKDKNKYKTKTDDDPITINEVKESMDKVLDELDCKNIRQIAIN